MRIHFIAIGGSAMHNLAMALHYNHHTVSGSDDEIYDPARSRLESIGLLPTKMGWDPARISPDLDAIILGMHARKDNPELLEAQRIGLPIYSYPEYIYQEAKDKSRWVIAGSHGKTSTTSMVLHALKKLNLNADYLVGAQLPGFKTMVRLSDAPLMVLEGDEYLSSPIDRRPKFLHYHPNTAIITGIAWDHINVFPTFENYLEQFQLFVNELAPEGRIYYFGDDKHLQEIAAKNPSKAMSPYFGFEGHAEGDQMIVRSDKGNSFKVGVFGDHNLQNLKAASLLCAEQGIEQEQFLEAMADFQGAAKRLQLLNQSEKLTIYQDFAHAPSKVKATLEAVRKQYPDKKIVAALELHTFSSLNKKFLPLYRDTLSPADGAAVFFQKHTLEMKKLPSLDTAEVSEYFGGEVDVFQEQEPLISWLRHQLDEDSVVLLMSSGTFGGLDYRAFAEDLSLKA
ncbi:MAG: peptidoglycan synthetase [Saprospiraceae bacterium]|nr:peptidoglycan synthetase [Saprospiraceae bacterium]